MSAAQQTILMVEDDILVRMAIAQYLRDCGYRVIEAANADEATTILLHVDGTIDIVLSDVEMPGSVDGFGLSRWIREHRPGVDIMLAGTVPRVVNAAHELCESNPAPTPYEPQAVLDHIRRLLANRDAAAC